MGLTSAMRLSSVFLFSGHREGEFLKHMLRPSSAKGLSGACFHVGASLGCSFVFLFSVTCLPQSH